MKVYFRALIPSWRFFSDYEELPELEYQWFDSLGKESIWFNAVPPFERGLSALVFNPFGNRNHAYHSLLQRAVNEMIEFLEGHPSNESQGAAAFEKSVSYRLLMRLVRSRFDDNVAAQRFKIKITRGNETILSSPTYEVRAQ